MPRRRLSESALRKLPPRNAPYPDPELPGHYFRIGKPKRIGLVIARDPAGTQKWETVADLADVSLDESRDLARAKLRRLRTGQYADDTETSPPSPPATSSATCSPRACGGRQSISGCSTGISCRAWARVPFAPSNAPTSCASWTRSRTVTAPGSRSMLCSVLGHLQLVRGSARRLQPAAR